MASNSSKISAAVVSRFFFTLIRTHPYLGSSILTATLITLPAYYAYQQYKLSNELKTKNDELTERLNKHEETIRDLSRKLNDSTQIASRTESQNRNLLEQYGKEIRKLRQDKTELEARLQSTAERPHEQLAMRLLEELRQRVSVVGIRLKKVLPTPIDSMQRKAIEVFNEGVDLWETGLFEPASERFRAAKYIDSNLVDAQANLFLSLFLAHLDDAAVEAFTGFPPSALDNFAIGMIHFIRHEFPKAESAFSRNSLNELDCLLFTCRAMLELTQNRIDDCIATCSAAHDQNCESAPIFMILAAAYEQGDVKKALSAYREALLLEPQNPTLLLDYGIALHNQNLLKDALVHLETASQIVPNVPKTWLVLAQVRQGLGDVKGAVVALQEVVRLDDNACIAHINLAGLLYLGEPDSAIYHANRALRLQPESQVARIHLGLAYYGKKDYFSAIKEFERVTPGRAQKPKALYYAACCYSLMGQPSQALSLLKEAIGSNPDFSKDARKDPDFVSLRQLTEFKDLVGEAH